MNSCLVLRHMTPAAVLIFPLKSMARNEMSDDRSGFPPVGEDVDAALGSSSLRDETREPSFCSRRFESSLLSTSTSSTPIPKNRSSGRVKAHCRYHGSVQCAVRTRLIIFLFRLISPYNLMKWTMITTTAAAGSPGVRDLATGSRSSSSGRLRNTTPKYIL